MSGSRQDYFNDLLRDCDQVCEDNDIHESDRAIVIAALIFSDSVNGLRKALLMPPRQPGVATSA